MRLLLSTCRVQFNDSRVLRKADGVGWPKSVGAKRSSALDRRPAVAAAAAAYVVSHGAEARMGNAIHIPVADGSHAKSVPGTQVPKLSNLVTIILTRILCLL